MRQTLSKGLVVAAAATSALSLYGTWASAAPRMLGTAAESPAVLSGNTTPRDTPGEPDAQETAYAEGTSAYEDGTSGDGDGTSGYGDGTSGYGGDTPGYGAEEPSDHPSCGCSKSPTPTPTPTKTVTPPPTKSTPPAPPSPMPTPSKTPPVTPPAPPKMAETGAESVLVGTAASAALMAAGTVLYRRGRAASRR
ncbi:hypothetical protein [Streptomyces sp. NPDC058466]|uniref:hypothetical protein n=1 Tax=Streptomyces sp. NPDC058466 TaxID=3346512 RepID=UPI003668613C